MQPQIYSWVLSDINISTPEHREKLISLWELLEERIHKEISQKGYASIESLDWSTTVYATLMDIPLKLAFSVLEKLVSMYSSIEGWQVVRYDYGGYSVKPGKIIPPYR